MQQVAAKKPMRSRLAWVGVIITIVMMGAGLAPIYFLPTEPSAFLQNVANLGQFISGLFAPLAFVWVVIAVMLQSRELELQREELANSRRALELQHEELRKTVEQHVQQTRIMTEELSQKNTDFQARVIEENVLYICSRLVDICDDLTIRGDVDPDSSVISIFGPVLFTIGEEAELLKLSQAKNYSAFFDYVHRRIVSVIGLLEQSDCIKHAAKHYGGGGVGIRALSFVLLLFNEVEDKVSSERLTELEVRLRACNFTTVGQLLSDLMYEIGEVQAAVES